MSNRWKRLALAGVLAALGAAITSAQQPFVTDDAEVTPRGRLHFEYANQFYILQKSARPNLRQDTNNFVVQYGLLDGVEVNMDFPLIAIGNARGSGTPSVFGLGDVDFAAKWNLVPETPDGGHPGFTVTAAAEFPTGSEKKQLGSGRPTTFSTRFCRRPSRRRRFTSTPGFSFPATRKRVSWESGLPATFSSAVSLPPGTFRGGSAWDST